MSLNKIDEISDWFDNRFSELTIVSTDDTQIFDALKNLEIYYKVIEGVKKWVIIIENGIRKTENKIVPNYSHTTLIYEFLDNYDIKSYAANDKLKELIETKLNKSIPSLSYGLEYNYINEFLKTI